MNDVNLSNPDLRLVRSSEQALARASASPQSKGSDASARSAISSTDVFVSVQPPSLQNISAAITLRSSREDQRELLNSAVTKLNEFVQTVQRDLKFEVDSELGQTIVRVVDKDSQEVIRQIPDEVALRLAENLLQDEPLTLFSEKV